MIVITKTLFILIMSLSYPIGAPCCTILWDQQYLPPLPHQHHSFLFILFFITLLHFPLFLTGWIFPKLQLINILLLFPPPPQPCQFPLTPSLFHEWDWIRSIALALRWPGEEVLRRIHLWVLWDSSFDSCPLGHKRFWEVYRNESTLACIQMTFYLQNQPIFNGNLHLAIA